MPDAVQGCSEPDSDERLGLRLRMAVSVARPVVIALRVWRKDSDCAMFEPDYLNVTCPRCHNVEIYFDREMGFYCMLCGHQFTTEQIQLLMETERLRKSHHSVGTETSGGAQKGR